jgi:two-component system sensor histidine kinase DegS
MNLAAKPWLKMTGRIISEYHILIITVIILALTFIYYTWECSTPITKHWLSWFDPIIIFEYKYDVNGILFYIPLFYAALIYWWRGVLIVWLVSMAIILQHIVYFSPDNASLTVNIFNLLVPLVVVIIIALELRWREQQRKIVAEREAERQTYMQQIFEAQEGERYHIARELHDDTTQTLLVIANRAQSLLNDAGSQLSPQVKEQTESIRDAILQVSEEMRRLSLNLRPDLLDSMGLLPALRWLVERLEQEDKINAQMVVSGVARQLPHEREVIIFRFVQEALSNIRRHSEATKAVVNLEFDQETVIIKIQDNGKGFELPEKIGEFTSEGKLGVVGMQERAGFLGGNFKINTAPNKGTTVSIEFKV